MTDLPPIPESPLAWLRENPTRSVIAAELHARPVQTITPPARIRRAVFLGESSDRSMISNLHRRMVSFGLEQIPSSADLVRQIEYGRGAYHVVFERHNEFATLTWHTTLDDKEPWPEGIGLELFTDLSLIVATRIDVTDTDLVSEAARASFHPSSLCFSTVYKGQAQIATDLLRDEHGFTHYELAAHQCSPLRAGVIVRRLLEIDTYSTLVLLGLPLARRYARDIDTAEAALATHVRRPETVLAGNQAALDRLHTLSMDVGHIVEATSFRFAAGRAYGEILRARLQRLEETSIGEFTTLQRYLNNRVEPALATCQATERRLDRLSGKIQGSIELLDARINLGLQTQNQAVLDTIAKTAQSQYHLQKTVEGLSIIAISYYSLSILGYVFEGLSHTFILPLSKSEAMMIAAPLVLLIVWLGLRNVRKD